MRILTNNIVANNTSISMTNSDINYPVENIYDNALEAKAQASTNTTAITAAFDTEQSINSIFFGFHNATVVTFVFKDSGGGTLDTVVFTNPIANAKEYIDELTNVRSIEITLSTAETYIFIGGIACGIYTEVYNVRLPIAVEHIDSSLWSQTSGGQFLFRTGFTLQGFTVDCAKISDEEVDAFMLAFSYVHKGKTFWLDRTEDQNKQIFCAFVSNIITVRIDEQTDLTFTIKEAK